MVARESQFSYPAWAEELSRELRELDISFHANRHRPEERMGAYLIALGKIALALKKLPGFDAEMLTLMDLAARLDGLASGQKSALLPIKSIKGGRPDYSTSDWITVGKAAAVVSFLIERGIQEPEACKRVAKALASYKVLGRRGEALTADTVREWRSATQRFDNKTEAPTVYQQTLDMLKKHTPAGVSPRQLNQALTSMLKPFKTPLPSVS
jgi:hypothetical protein